MTGDHAVAAVEQSDARSETLYMDELIPVSTNGGNAYVAFHTDEPNFSSYTDKYGWWEIVAQNLKDAEAELRKAYDIVQNRIEVNMPEELASLYGNITKERYAWAKRRLENECKNDAEIDIEEDWALMVFGPHDDVQAIIAVAVDYLGMVIDDEWDQDNYPKAGMTFFATLTFEK